LGVTPEAADEDGTARKLRITIDVGDVLTLTYDAPGRSIRCRWEKGESVVIDVFREGATRLAVDASKAETSLVSEFETDSLAGRLKLRVFPTVRIVDELLLA
jgi:hypothetical protein